MQSFSPVLAPGSDILQSGYVVADLDQAMAGWLALGVGPFIRLDVDLDEVDYRGVKAPYRARFALGQAGSTQIELIEPVGAGPDIYRDSVPVGETALHHIMKLAPDYDAELSALRKAGFVVACEGNLDGLRFAYVDTRSSLGYMLELVDDCEAIRTLFRAVKEAAIGWDGADPVRFLEKG